MQGLSAPVWDQTQTDPLPCARYCRSFREKLNVIVNGSLYESVLKRDHSDGTICATFL